LLLFSITLNVALKGTFQIPLARELGIPGYAFPSGHMQIATIFYASLIFYGNARLLKNDPESLLLPLNITLVLLLSGIGWSLIHCGYHTVFDVAGAAITALLLIIGYRFLLNHCPNYSAWILLCLATLVTLYSCTRYPELPQHAKLAFYGLIGLIAGNTIIRRYSSRRLM
jgi:undecaprenyl-diphosphatase